MIPVAAVGFLALAGLLLWFVIGSRGGWWLKLAVIVGTCAFTFAVWDALDSFSGWATAQEPPARALFVSGVVDEPNAIYVWLIAPTDAGLFGYRQQTDEPRGYRLRYTRRLHENVDRANALRRRGQPVELRRMPGQSGRDAPRAIQIHRLRPHGLPPKSHRH